jgi:polyisoprenoid-binding protein YceI
MNLLLQPPRNVPAPGTYSLHPDHCSVELSVRHLVARTVRGRIAPLGGELHLDTDDLGASSLWIDLDAESLTTGHAGRDAVVKGPELLDVDRFPFLRFESRGIVDRGRGRASVAGDLYVRDQVGEVELDVRLLPSRDGRITCIASTEVHRSAIGLRWAQRFERLGLVGDTVKVRLGVELNR